MMQEKITIELKLLFNKEVETVHTYVRYNETDAAIKRRECIKFACSQIRKYKNYYDSFKIKINYT